MFKEEVLRLMGWKLTKTKLGAMNENTIKFYVLNIHMTRTNIDYADIIASTSISFPNQQDVGDAGLGWKVDRWPQGQAGKIRSPM
jgi:hypothetical protein